MPHRAEADYPGVAVPRRKNLIQPHGRIAGALDRHDPRAPADRMHGSSGAELGREGAAVTIRRLTRIRPSRASGGP